MVKEIPLTQGKVALVDDEDYPRISNYKWYAIKHNNHPNSWYAVTSQPRRNTRMQYVIMGTKKQYDHINGDGLDNTRKNLREATTKQNAWNRRKRVIPCSSKYKGVAKIPGRDSWQCRIFIGGKRFYIGYFTSEEEAARAYDAKAIELYGEYAKTNFPQDKPVVGKGNAIIYRCGDCNSWHRGGMGAGSGGGYCYRYMIPKNKNNTLAAINCAKQYPEWFSIDCTKGETEK